MNLSVLLVLRILSLSAVLVLHYGLGLGWWASVGWAMLVFVPLAVLICLRAERDDNNAHGPMSQTGNSI